MCDTPICWMQVTCGGRPLPGRIYFRLHTDVVPKTCENFISLCKGFKRPPPVEGAEPEEGVAELTYKGSVFHRVISNFMIQGGDILNGDGTGTVSIYGAEFEDENFKSPCERAGLLAMANRGPNTNGSQFFITTVPCPHLTGKHVVFGEVIKNMGLVRRMEKMPTGPNDRPVQELAIADCGAITEEEYQHEMEEAATASAGGAQTADAKYEDYPEDNEKQLDEAEALEAAAMIKSVGNDFFKTGDAASACEKYEKAIRYLDTVLETSANEERLLADKISCQNNITMAQIKLSSWADAEKSATAVLNMDPKNIKALFRRATARVEVKDFDGAEEDLRACLAIESSNADAKNKLADVEMRKKKQKEKMQKGLKKLFGGA